MVIDEIFILADDARVQFVRHLKSQEKTLVCVYFFFYLTKNRKRKEKKCLKLILNYCTPYSLQTNLLFVYICFYFSLQITKKFTEISFRIDSMAQVRRPPRYRSPPPRQIPSLPNPIRVQLPTRNRIRAIHPNQFLSPLTSSTNQLSNNNLVPNIIKFITQSNIFCYFRSKNQSFYLH